MLKRGLRCRKSDQINGKRGKGFREGKKPGDIIEIRFGMRRAGEGGSAGYTRDHKKEEAPKIHLIISNKWKQPFIR